MLDYSRVILYCNVADNCTGAFWTSRPIILNAVISNTIRRMAYRLFGTI